VAEPNVVWILSCQRLCPAYYLVLPKEYSLDVVSIPCSFYTNSSAIPSNSAAINKPPAIKSDP
jgi:hypothetical protein